MDRSLTENPPPGENNTSLLEHTFDAKNAKFNQNILTDVAQVAPNRFDRWIARKKPSSLYFSIGPITMGSRRPKLHPPESATILNR
ncbi:MAG: hypothetical protein GY820_22170 [Gammaproteobacteria bacterium]|nr:hypothetical protein [Gammaproteobacteria bacterium]